MALVIEFACVHVLRPRVLYILLGCELGCVAFPDIWPPQVPDQFQLSLDTLSVYSQQVMGVNAGSKIFVMTIASTEKYKREHHLVKPQALATPGHVALPPPSQLQKKFTGTPRVLVF